MASWQPKEFNINNINGGSRYEDGDGLGAETINAVVEASALVQNLGKNQPQYTQNGGNPSVSIQNDRFVFSNLKGDKGDKGEQGIQGVGVPEGGTVGQVLTKTEYGTSWQDSKGGGGTVKTLLYMAGAKGMYGYEVYFKLPMQGVSKVTINYTAQYNNYAYQQEYGNTNVVIYDSSQSIPNLRPTLRLLTDDYSYETYVDVPVSWRGDGETLYLDFYSATNNAFGTPYGATDMSILFTLE